MYYDEVRNREDGNGTEEEDLIVQLSRNAAAQVCGLQEGGGGGVQEPFQVEYTPTRRARLWKTIFRACSCIRGSIHVRLLGWEVK